MATDHSNQSLHNALQSFKKILYVELIATLNVYN